MRVRLCWSISKACSLRQSYEVVSWKARAGQRRSIAHTLSRGRHSGGTTFTSHGFDIQILGSGSKMPSLRCSCPAVGFRGARVQWLFDAGEGTQRQLIQSMFRVGKIDSIFITHLHGDHLFGLPGLVLCICGQMAASKFPPLNIYGPPGLYNYICMTLKLCDARLTPKENKQPLLVVHELVDKSSPNNSWNVNPLLSRPLRELRYPGVEYVTIPRNSQGYWEVKRQAPLTVMAGQIEHRGLTFGYVVKEDDKRGSIDAKRVKAMGLPPGRQYLDLVDGRDITLPNGVVIKASEVVGPSKSGRKVTILGDTCNPYNIVDLAMDSDILIHETTLEDAAMSLAKSRGHSTPSMAAAFARDCRAKRLVMTHFSARYVAPKHEGGPLLVDLPFEETMAMDLVEEAIKVLGKDRVIPAQDLLALSVPVGGFEPIKTKAEGEGEQTSATPIQTGATAIL